MFSILSFVAFASADQWAVIAAGSNQYWNYRHHADVCHAYKIMLKGGLSPDKIILMMFNDVPYAEDNPFEGELYNHPGVNPEDVLEGCRIDYSGNAVSHQMFHAVLTGDKEAAKNISGKDTVKVLESGPEDTVFINFVDHGGEGLIAFPSDDDDVMTALELHAVLNKMHEKNMYKQVLFYMEACESGSMFSHESDLPPNFLALTAANETSSYAYYCPPNDVVKGQEMNTCLGDEFSIMWMEDDDVGSKVGESIEAQFILVKNETNDSQVCMWGDKSIAKEPVSTFIGTPKNSAKFRGHKGRKVTKEEQEQRRRGEGIPSRDVPLRLAYWRFYRAAEGEKKKFWSVYQKLLKEREETKELFKNIIRGACDGNEQCISASENKEPVGKFPLKCHNHLVQKVKKCGWTPEALQYSRNLAHVCTFFESVSPCRHRILSRTLDAGERITQVCTQQKIVQAAEDQLNEIVA